MSTPSIGGYTFVAWQGTLKYGAPDNTQFDQIGVAGVGIYFGAYKTRPQPIVTTYRASSGSDATSTLTAYRSLITNTVSVIDQFGISWPSTIVVAVDGMVSFDPVGWIMTATWSLLPQSN